MANPQIPARPQFTPPPPPPARARPPLAAPLPGEGDPGTTIPIDLEDILVEAEAGPAEPGRR